MFNKADKHDDWNQKSANIYEFIYTFALCCLLF